ncbi:Protein MAIN-LIKE 2 [Linum perenne]
MRQNNSSLTWDPAYEAFVGGCRLREVVRVLGVTPCKELVTTLIERWRTEWNAFHLVQGEATITLEDVEVLIGLPTRGLPVTGRADRRSVATLCERWLGVIPPSNAISRATMKISWVKRLFGCLLEGATLRLSPSMHGRTLGFSWAPYCWPTGLRITYQRTC